MPDDLKIVARIAEGDSESPGMLYDLHGPLVYRLALRIVGDPRDAEEVICDGFVRQTEAGVERVIAWLARAAGRRGT